MARKSNTNGVELGIALQGLVQDESMAGLLVKDLVVDTRLLNPGDVFIALPGKNSDGTQFIEDAVTKGATAILVESGNIAIGKSTPAVPVYGVTNLASNLGLIASRFYNDPSEKLRLTGITGTNGKTSTASYLVQLLGMCGDTPAGMIGTLGAGIFGDLAPMLNTTPDVVSINRLLSGFRTQGVKDVVMEVSSHGLEQGRISGVSFETAVFTNLSRDHLDYHADMQAYGEAKRKLFMARGLNNAVINIDDAFGASLYSEFRDRLDCTAYSIGAGSEGHHPDSDIYADIVAEEAGSITFDIGGRWGSGRVIAPFSGRYNISNLLATISVLCLYGIPLQNVMRAVGALQQVPGRLELFTSENSPRIYVDYSHTPDALEQALKTLRGLCSGRLFCVFGCGGDRDPGKRPEMGRVAANYADRIYITSDNPRTEDPPGIIEDIREGIASEFPVFLEPDRATAIRNAIAESNLEDIVLVAGKGHEDYQEIRGERFPFSDRLLVRNLLEKMA